MSKLPSFTCPLSGDVSEVPENITRFPFYQVNDETAGVSRNVGFFRTLKEAKDKSRSYDESSVVRITRENWLEWGYDASGWEYL